MIISEEMLGAYLEGNLSTEEMSDLEQVIGLNSELRALVNDLSSLNIDWDDSIINDHPDFESNFELPLISSFDLTDDSISPYDNQYNIEVFSEIDYCADSSGDIQTNMSDIDEIHIPTDDGLDSNHLDSSDDIIDISDK